MPELVHGEKEHSGWFSEWSIFSYTDCMLRWTALKLTSLIRVLERIFNRKHFCVKKNPFP